MEPKKDTGTKPSRSRPKPINLALQGGGAHGAFTWGVLDRLLEDERITIEAISGTSAGAMNAVALADGFQKNGCMGARQALLSFWRAASQAACFSPFQRTPLDRLMGSWSLNTSPGYLMMDLLSRLASPYELNPFNFNPVRDFLAQQIDFDSVRRCGGIKLFISATSVRTGRSHRRREPGRRQQIRGGQLVDRPLRHHAGARFSANFARNARWANQDRPRKR